MTWDNGPWAIEGGQTSADVGRLMAWHATSGIYGIARPTDLRVRAKDVPGGQVLVSPGGVVVPCKALGKFLQSYVGLNPSDDPIDIPATGSSGARSDLIVARVENPITGEPWTLDAGVDPLTAPYIFTRRYPSVPNTTTHVNQVDPSASAFTLARIDIPANTGTITQAMIKDLRDKPATGEPPMPTTPMAAANQDVWIAQHFDRATVVDDVLPYTQTAYTIWPDAAVWPVVVPKDATEIVADFSVTAEQRPTSGQPTNLGHVWGYLRLRVIGTGVDFSIDVEFDRDYVGGGSPTTVTLPVGGTEAVPAAARGKTLTFQLEGRMFSDANTRGRLVITKGSYIRGHIHFNVKPASA